MHFLFSYRYTLKTGFHEDITQFLAYFWKFFCACTSPLYAIIGCSALWQWVSSVVVGSSIPSTPSPANSSARRQLRFMAIMLSSTAVTSFNWLLFLSSCGKSTWRIQRNLLKHKSKPQKKINNSWCLKQNNIAFCLCSIWLLKITLSAAPLITS